MFGHYLLIKFSLLCPFLMKVFVLFIYFTTLGLCCCIWAFSGCSEQGLHSTCGLLAVASLVTEHELSSHSFQALEYVGFSSCGSQA